MASLFILRAECGATGPRHVVTTGSRSGDDPLWQRRRRRTNCDTPFTVTDSPRAAHRRRTRGLPHPLRPRRKMRVRPPHATSGPCAVPSPQHASPWRATSRKERHRERGPLTSGRRSPPSRDPSHSGAVGASLGSPSGPMWRRDTPRYWRAPHPSRQGWYGASLTGVYGPMDTPVGAEDGTFCHLVMFNPTYRRQRGDFGRRTGRGGARGIAPQQDDHGLTRSLARAEDERGETGPRGHGTSPGNADIGRRRDRGTSPASAHVATPCHGVGGRCGRSARCCGIRIGGDRDRQYSGYRPARRRNARHRDGGG